MLKAASSQPLRNGGGHHEAAAELIALGAEAIVIYNPCTPMPMQQTSGRRRRSSARRRPDGLRHRQQRGLLREVREFERGSQAAVNAALCSPNLIGQLLPAAFRAARTG